MVNEKFSVMDTVVSLTTGKPSFVVRFLSGARQRTSLPCALYRAHGKDKTHRKNCLPCVFLGARQTFFPNVRRPRVDTEGKPLAPRGGQFFSLSLSCAYIKRTANMKLCRAP
jgi:hypothetical protein